MPKAALPGDALRVLEEEFSSVDSAERRSLSLEGLRNFDVGTIEDSVVIAKI